VVVLFSTTLTLPPRVFRAATGLHYRCPHPRLFPGAQISVIKSIRDTVPTSHKTLNKMLLAP
jgi:hypothetical protein